MVHQSVEKKMVGHFLERTKPYVQANRRSIKFTFEASAVPLRFLDARCLEPQLFNHGPGDNELLCPSSKTNFCHT